MLPLLLATVFLTGACVLVLEIAGSRVMAPLYGSGLYSWSALISVTLASLSLGYWVGGRAADRRPDRTLFHGAILVAGLLVLGIPWAAPAALRLTEPLDPRLGVLLAAAALFFPPLAVLGAVTPFAIRLAQPDRDRVGALSGLIFAVSTIGSLLAALATGFLLIPNLGVRAILTLTGATLILVAGLGLFASRRRAWAGAAVVLAIAGLAARPGADGAGSSPSFRILARTPSFFGFIRVVETHTERMLTVDGIGQNYVSLDPHARPSDYLEFMGALPRLHRAGSATPSALLIGLGAGELAGRLQAAGVHLTVVEIDPRIEATARRFFGLALPRERIHFADGRAFLERDTAAYDFLFMDAFVGEEVPGHLFTREAFEAMRGRLAPGGILAINYTSFPGGRDTRSIARTLPGVFPHVHVFTDGSPAGELASNVFVASLDPMPLDPSMAPDVPSAQLFLSHEAPLPEDGATLLTDDYNPINVYRLGATRQWRKLMIAHIGEDRAYWTDF